jgi:hypothetical protein
MLLSVPQLANDLAMFVYHAPMERQLYMDASGVVIASLPAKESASFSPSWLTCS